MFSFIFTSIEPTKFPLYFLSFLSFGVTGILYSSTHFSYKILYKSIFVISLLSLPGIYKISNTDYTHMGDVSGFWMGISQGALRLLLGVILVIPFLKNKFLKVFSIAIIVLYLIFYFKFGTRGAILGLFLFSIFFYLIKKDLLKIRIFVLITVAGIILSFFLVDIMILLQSSLASIGLSIKALNKMVAFSHLNKELSNGRLDLWIKAFDDISRYPFFGNGITVYEHKYGIYPHNFLIQVFYEGGVIYLFPILLVLLKLVKLLLSKHQSKEIKLFLIYLFFGGIIELVFSNVYWRNVYFWFFIGYVLSIPLKPKKHLEKAFFVRLKKVNIL